MTQPRKSSRRADQLPPGRNRRGPEYVANNQRARIIDAVIDVASLAGYAATTVEQICGVAGLSRRTFYDLFADREEAFLAALDETIAAMDAAAGAALENAQDFPSSARDALAAFLGYLADQPERADMLLVESLAAGPAAVERRRASLVGFAELLHRGAERHSDAAGRPPALTAETIVGGIYEVAYSRALAGQTASLPELLPDLVYSVLQPYLGHDAALAEARIPPARPA